MPQAIIAIVLIAILLVVGRSWLRKRTAAQLAGSEVDGGASLPGGIPQDTHSAPLAEFHIVGPEARVTFDVPLDDDDDQILNDLLVDEAVEVVRQKQHSLPIDEVQHVVVFAGRGSVREIGRTKLPSPGVLPPPPPVNMLNLGNVTRDPFTAEVSTEHAVAYETKADVPADELPPIGKELKIPKGLERGLRATGIDVDAADGQDIILGLLRLFGYTVAATPEPHIYMASKAGETTLVVADPYKAGDYPEVEEATIRAFTGRFSMSGASRAVFVSEKYAPFMIYSLEKNEPRIRFITRERLQEFIDLMALG